MILCTILYVEYTEANMGQGSKKILMRLLKELFENMLRHNSLFSITNTKETKLSLIGQLFFDLRDTSQLFLRGFHH